MDSSFLVLLKFTLTSIVSVCTVSIFISFPKNEEAFIAGNKRQTWHFF